MDLLPFWLNTVAIKCISMFGVCLVMCSRASLLCFLANNMEAKNVFNNGRLSNRRKMPSFRGRTWRGNREGCFAFLSSRSFRLGLLRQRRTEEHGSLMKKSYGRSRIVLQRDARPISLLSAFHGPSHFGNALPAISDGGCYVYSYLPPSLANPLRRQTLAWGKLQGPALLKCCII